MPFLCALPCERVIPSDFRHGRITLVIKCPCGQSNRPILHRPALGPAVINSPFGCAIDCRFAFNAISLSPSYGIYFLFYTIQDHQSRNEACRNQVLQALPLRHRPQLDEQDRRMWPSCPCNLAGDW